MLVASSSARCGVAVSHCPQKMYHSSPSTKNLRVIHPSCRNALSSRYSAGRIFHISANSACVHKTIFAIVCLLLEFHLCRHPGHTATVAVDRYNPVPHHILPTDE